MRWDLILTFWAGCAVGGFAMFKFMLSELERQLKAKGYGRESR